MNKELNRLTSLAKNNNLKLLPVMRKKELKSAVREIIEKVNSIDKRLNELEHMTIDASLNFTHLANKELEVGKWYKGTYYHTKYLAFPTELYKETIVRGYGFNDEGVWELFKDNAGIGNNTRLATPQEVQQALTNEAIKRGHKYDVYSWNHEQNTLYGNRGNDVGHDILFENGVWSEVIEVDKFVELKEAHKNGALIQIKGNSTGTWYDIYKPSWEEKNEYRIKPEEKPKVGDVCKFWDDDENAFIVAIYAELREDNQWDDMSFTHPHGVRVTGNYHTRFYKHAKTLTQQEAIDLLFNDKS